MSGHLRFRRRVGIFPGLTMNIGRQGVSSFSVGRRGAHLTFGRRGIRTTVGLPGSGLSYSVSEPYRTAGRQRTSPGMFLLWVVVVLVLIAIGTIFHIFH